MSFTRTMIGTAAAFGLTTVLAGAALAQQGTPNTTNKVPSECAKMTTAQAKDECARTYNQKTTPGTNQGELNGTGVGKGQGSGQGVGTGSGQGATHGVGRDNKK